MEFFKRAKEAFTGNKSEIVSRKWRKKPLIKRYVDWYNQTYTGPNKRRQITLKYKNSTVDFVADNLNSDFYSGGKAGAEPTDVFVDLMEYIYLVELSRIAAIGMVEMFHNLEKDILHLCNEIDEVRKLVKDEDAKQEIVYFMNELLKGKCYKILQVGRHKLGIYPTNYRKGKYSAANMQKFINPMFAMACSTAYEETLGKFIHEYLKQISVHSMSGQGAYGGYKLPPEGSIITEIQNHFKRDPAMYGNKTYDYYIKTAFSREVVLE